MAGGFLSPFTRRRSVADRPPQPRPAAAQHDVRAAQRAKPATGALVIARSGEGYALLPRAAVQVRERGADCIVLDHGLPSDAAGDASSDDDAYYAQYQVPDDLVW